MHRWRLLRVCSVMYEQMYTYMHIIQHLRVIGKSSRNIQHKLGPQRHQRAPWVWRSR